MILFSFFMHFLFFNFIFVFNYYLLCCIIILNYIIYFLIIQNYLFYAIKAKNFNETELRVDSKPRTKLTQRISKDNFFVRKLMRPQIFVSYPPKSTQTIGQVKSVRDAFFPFVINVYRNDGVGNGKREMKQYLRPLSETMETEHPVSKFIPFRRIKRKIFEF